MANSPDKDVITSLLHWWRIRSFSIPMMQAAFQTQGTLGTAALGAADVGVRRYEYSRSRVTRLVLKRFSDTEFMEHSCAEQHVSCSNVSGKNIRFFSDGANDHSIMLYQEVSARIPKRGNGTMKLQMRWFSRCGHPGGSVTAMCGLRNPTPSSSNFFITFTTLQRD